MITFRMRLINGLLPRQGKFWYKSMMGDFQEILFNVSRALPSFLLAVVAHEWAHAKMAYRFGDATAKAQGRMTFNPAVHIDPFGTIIFPLLGVILGWAVIGWARPVPVNPRNFKDIRKGIFWVSFAGPLMNLFLGTLMAFLYASIAVNFDRSFTYYEVILQMLEYGIFINFLLGFFNLIPLPPLDGSGMVSSFLKGEAQRKYDELRRYTPMIFLAIIALSMLGIPTIGLILGPLMQIGSKLTMMFLHLMS